MTPPPGPRTLMLCGRCSHPMHWHECGADADLTSGPCRCRNAIEAEARAGLDVERLARALHKAQPHWKRETATWEDHAATHLEHAAAILAALAEPIGGKK